MESATVNRRRSAYSTMLGSTASTLVAAAQSLILLPLYLSEFGPGLYGAWLATGEVLVWMLAFDFGIPNLLIQRSGSLLARGDRRAIGSHFAASQLALVVVALVMTVAVYSFAPLIAHAIGTSGADAVSLVASLRIAVFSTSLMLVAYGLVGLARGLQDTSIVQGASLAGTVAGFAVTAALLVSHFGLASIAYGLLARSLLTLLGGLWYFVFRLDADVRRSVVPSKGAFIDMARHCPPMFAAGIAYALMNNSMITMAAVMFRPEMAVVLGVTRKAADLVRMVLDMIGHASYGGFAHLFSSGDKPRVLAVYRELQSTFFLVATSLFAAYVAINPALIEAWVGKEMFGGLVLTLFLALGSAAASWSYFQISLYRSIGNHGVASAALLVECAARLAIMVALGMVLGPIGLAAGGLLTAVLSGVWASRRISRQIGAPMDVAQYSTWIWRGLPFAGAVVIGFVGVSGDWGMVLCIGSLVCAAALATLIAMDPALYAYKRKLIGGQA